MADYGLREVKEMEKVTTKTKKEIFEHLKENQFVYLATVEGDRPRVRPVTLGYYEEKLWILTGTKDAKAKQVRDNPNIEICCMLDDGKNKGYIRFICKAGIVTNKETKARIAPKFPFFKDYWSGTDDPDYTLLVNQVERIEYMPPGEFLAMYYEM